MGTATAVQPDLPAVANADTWPTDAHANTHGVAQPDATSLVGDAAFLIQPRVTAGAQASSQAQMTTFRAVLPLLRAFVLAGVAIYLILFGLPAILGIAAAATP